MNKLTYFFAALFLVATMGIKAQVSSGTPATNYGILSNKLKKSDASFTDEKKSIKPKFWIQRAELMMDCYDVNRQFLFQGTPVNQIKLFFGEPKENKTWQKDGSNYEQLIYESVNITFKDGKMDSYEETKPIHPDPLPEALKSLEKAEELDAEKNDVKQIKKDYIRLKTYIERQAIEDFTANNFNEALDKFKTMLSINDKPIMEGLIDTIIFYNTGMTAAKAGNNPEAIKYYELARKYNHSEPNLYSELKKKYFIAGDTAMGLTVLEEGLKKFPDNQAILIEYINYFLLNGKSNEAFNYLKIAQKNDPENISFINAEGKLYYDMGQIDNALASYQRCITKDSTYFDAYLNIGLMYYNNAVKLNDNANNLKDNKEYNEAKKLVDAELAKSIPYLEKAHKINPTESLTMETLKGLYYRLQMTDKYNAIINEISGK
jgi:tetratricopeptide (TPR) repeat protein